MAGHGPIPVDYINLRNIQLPLLLIVEPDAWKRSGKPQPAIISVRVAFPRDLIHEAGRTDSVATTLNYSSLYRVLEGKQRSYSEQAAARGEGMNLNTLIDSIEHDLQVEQNRCIREIYKARGLQSPGEFRELEVTLHLPKAILRAAGGLKCFTHFRQSEWIRREAWIQGIRSYCIIGVNEHERLEKQAVDVSLGFKFEGESRDQELRDFVNDYHSLTSLVGDTVDTSSFETVEALATRVASLVIVDCGFSEVTVKAEKLSALPFVEYSGVEITRTTEFFEERDME